MKYPSALTAIFTLACCSGVASASVIEDYNMVLFNDFSPSGGSGHIHGKAFIGGDLNGSSPEFGADLDKSMTDNSLEVAGNLNAGQVKVQAGYLAYGGSNNLGQINCNGNGLTNGNACLKPVSGLDSKAANLYSELSAESAYYSSLSNTGSVTGNLFSYSGTSTDLAVFSIDGSDLFSQNSTWNLDFGTASNVVINVSGDILSSGGGINLNGGFSHSNEANILWNFYEADSINLGSTQWFGTIYALDASIYTGNDLNGTLVADSYVGDGQIHIANWTYEPPETNVPEPNVVFLMLTGLGFLGFGRLRRSSRA
jgi:choice-of-anchor A domain-containing protein